MCKSQTNVITFASTSFSITVQSRDLEKILVDFRRHAFYGSGGDRSLRKSLMFIKFSANFSLEPKAIMRCACSSDMASPATSCDNRWTSRAEM